MEPTVRTTALATALHLADVPDKAARTSPSLVYLRIVTATSLTSEPWGTIETD